MTLDTVYLNCFPFTSKIPKDTVGEGSFNLWEQRDNEL